MKGKSLALGGGTTAGFVFPLAWFRQHGVNDLEAFSGEKSFSGGHDRTIALVLNGKADIGAEKNTVNNSMSQCQRRTKNELMVLTSSPRVPSNDLCVRSDMDQEQKQQLDMTFF